MWIAIVCWSVGSYLLATVGTADDVTQSSNLVHHKEASVLSDACYQGEAEQNETQHIGALRHKAMCARLRAPLKSSSWTRAGQGLLSRDGRTPVSAHQMNIRLRQRHVPWAAQKHGQPDDNV
jgi:hypothetical protein